MIPRTDTRLLTAPPRWRISNLIHATMVERLRAEGLFAYHRFDPRDENLQISSYSRCPCGQLNYESSVNIAAFFSLHPHQLLWVTMIPWLSVHHHGSTLSCSAGSPSGILQIHATVAQRLRVERLFAESWVRLSRQKSPDFIEILNPCGQGCLCGMEVSRCSLGVKE